MTTGEISGAVGRGTNGRIGLTIIMTFAKPEQHHKISGNAQRKKGLSMYVSDIFDSYFSSLR